MTDGISGRELLETVKAVAHEKFIEPEKVLEALAEAVQRAARMHHAEEQDIRAEIDQSSGEIRLFRLRAVVAQVEHEGLQISLADAQARNPAAQVGDSLAEDLPPMAFGRIAAQMAKPVINQKVREAEREREYEEFKDRIGEVVQGSVVRAEYGDVIVGLEQGEGILQRNESLPSENFHPGDRVRALIYDVRREPRHRQIFLTRTRPQFMSYLFSQEVPEIYEGIVELRAVARDPGSRAKIAVISNDAAIDPVGACVGMRGNRVQAVVNELQGEKIDIVPWSPDPATFIVNALVPAEVTKVVLDEDRHKIEVVVPEEQLSLAIGRRGQNVRLASQLTGWSIDILTEDEESERRQKEFQKRSALFMDALDIDETMAQLLASEGFSSVEELAFSEADEVAQIKGFEPSTAEDLQNRAYAEIQRRNDEYERKRKEAGVADAVAEIPAMTPQMLAALGEHGVASLEDLAGCATDDLIGWYEQEEGERVRRSGIFEGIDIGRDAAESLIMQARRAVGWIAEAEEEFPEEEWVEEADADASAADVPAAEPVAAISIDAAMDAGDPFGRLPGITEEIRAALQKSGIVGLEDLAGCATDDLLGWEEEKDGKNVREEGVLSGLNVSAQTAQELIMTARKQAGWLEEEGEESR